MPKACPYVMIRNFITPPFLRLAWGVCMGLFQGDFVDATLVAAAFKIGVEEHLHHCQGFVVGHETAGHGDEISIVVLTRK